MSDSISAWVDQDEMRRLAESLISRPYGQELGRLEVDFGSQFEGFAQDSAVKNVASEHVFLPAQEPQVGKERAAESMQASVASDSSATLSPSVVRSAVQFLKKAQAEGRAGGIIREEKNSLPHSALSPSEVPAVNVSEPSEPEPRPIHSPFRRVSAVEQELASAIEPANSVPEPVFPGKLTRPPAPSGDEPILARVTQYGKWLKGPVGVRNFFVSNTEGKILIDEVANPKLIQVARSLAGASGGASEGEIGSLHVRIGEDSILEVVPTPSQFGTLILGLIVEHPLPEELIREIRLGLEEVADARLIKTQPRKK